MVLKTERPTLRMPESWRDHVTDRKLSKWLRAMPGRWHPILEITYEMRHLRQGSVPGDSTLVHGKRVFDPLGLDFT
jgi:hypothetical protein